MSWCRGTARAILSPEVYFSRGTRGTRTDVVTFYDPRKLGPSPRSASRRSAEATCRCSRKPALTDDDRFLVVYNFTPAQSVTIVDVKNKASVGEIDIGGCALVYPIGPRSFFSLCGDGTGSRAARRCRQAAASPHRGYPSTPSRTRHREGRARRQHLVLRRPLRATGPDTRRPAAAPGRCQRWSLLDDAARPRHWRPGGMQHLSVHAASGGSTA